MESGLHLARTLAYSIENVLERDKPESQSSFTVLDANMMWTL